MHQRNNPQKRSAMSTGNSGSEQIISGIAEDAKHEAETLIDDARKMAEERRSFARKKAERITDEASRKAMAQAEQTRQTVLSGIKVALKREQMRNQDEILQEVLKRVRNRLADEVSSPGYRQVLTGWIVEAITGLDAEEVQVNASKKERDLINSKVLGSAAKQVERITGKHVTCTLSTDAPLTGQGVTVTAVDGRTAFNNQIVTSIRRADRKIRNLVYDRLFTKMTGTSASSKQTEQP